MKTFNIKTCPLCESTLKLFYSGQQRAYYCPNLIDGTTMDGLVYHVHIQFSHYYVDIKDGKVIQNTYISPYKVVSEAGSDKSNVYKVSDPKLNIGTIPLLQHIMETPMITPENPDRLIKRIKNLVIFS
jgi:hypothetical protein